MEDTEWNDILREKGILPPLPVERSPSPEPIFIPNSLNKKNDSDSESESDIESEDLELDGAFESYRKQRLKAYQEAAEQRANRGKLLTITTHEDFKQKVTEGSRTIDVVVHLFDESVEACTILDSQLNELAQRFFMTRFYRMKATDCIPGYPSRHVPTLLIYQKGDLKTQFVQDKQIYGHATSTSLDRLQSVLQTCNVLNNSTQE